jgi:hypothetical protein
MVYNTQNYWVFGLCPSSGIIKSRDHNASGKKKWFHNILLLILCIGFHGLSLVTRFVA